MASVRTLKTFLAVVRHGSFAAAAAEVGLTPAAVGLQMQALEQSLGQALFDRGRRAVVLNPTGRRIVGEVEQLVRRWEALAAGTDGDEAGLSGVVVMGALVSALMGAFADALWAVKGANPRLDVKLFAGLSSDFAPRVARGELDAAIVTQPPYALPSNLVWSPMYAEPMVLIVPRVPRFDASGGALALLSAAPFIRFDRATWTGRLVDEVLSACRVRVHEGMELNSVEAMVEIVRQGFGVSVVPRLANVDWGRDRALRVLRLPGVDVQRHVGMLERASHARERFTGAIKRYFAERAVPRARRAAR
ncbi:LysR family transcriptional regulator [Piscinibacter sakaiensis]|uniref:LysR family transcriptional regulator n=1 Tax=Piscinibacter sakaiensis TaxID=1547922 RepID=UPI0006B66A00|nr:LysR family transcriptional regulator [Piscinibacter sakaiensis]